MHGEYKMPGGKLVVADVQVVDGALAQVQISGDFFLEPPSALDLINRALTGIPADAGVDAMQQAVENALDDRVAMFGISAQAVAIAVQRALEPPA